MTDFNAAIDAATDEELGFEGYGSIVDLALDVVASTADFFEHPVADKLATLDATFEDIRAFEDAVEAGEISDALAAEVAASFAYNLALITAGLKRYVERYG